MVNTPTVKLNDGHEMPLVGFGSWKVPQESAADTIYNALKTGYRLIDCAQDYGNEKECGEGLKRAIEEGIVKREDVFITSKLWNCYHAKEHVEPMLKKSLEDWGLEYFDLFLIHFPLSQRYVDPKERYPPGIVNDTEKGVAYYDNIPLSETWHALEDCVNKGLTKSIGISNFNSALIRDLVSHSKIPPAVLQIEHHPYLIQKDLITWVQNQGIAITAYSTFGPQSFLEMGHETAQNTPLLLEHKTVAEIANKHSRTPGQVILRWCVQRNIAVIPKSNNQGRLEQNLQCSEFKLSDQEVEQISGLDKGLRFNNPVEWNPPMPIF